MHIFALGYSEPDLNFYSDPDDSVCSILNIACTSAVAVDNERINHQVNRKGDITKHQMHIHIQCCGVNDRDDVVLDKPASVTHIASCLPETLLKRR